MAQVKVQQPRTQSIQSGNPNAATNLSVFQKVSMEKAPKFKDAVWPRHGTETMGQMARLLRGKLPK